MERVLKESSSRDSANSRRAAQGKFARHSAQGDLASRIDNSPHMIAQRKKLQSLFGGTAQLQGAEDEMLQRRFAALQRKHELGEEEFLPGKFGAAQRVEEEEPLQGKGMGPTGRLPVAQLVTILSTGSESSPSYEFTAEKSDLGKGTNTTEKTRNFVNGWTTIPGTVNYEYEIYDVSQSNKSLGVDSGSAPNPVPQNTGQRWDAGHSLGRQNGGLGDDNGWVFPQNPQFNRGNSYGGQKTFKDWRYCENVFHDFVSQYGKGRWKVWLS